MKFLKTCAFSVVLLAIVGALTASPASAQNLRGTFNLPFEAHWGAATLQPGQYTISLPVQATLVPILYISGEGKHVILPIADASLTQESERSYLRIDNFGDLHVVREFKWGPAGKVINFGVPKALRKQANYARNIPDTTVAVRGGN